MITPTDAARLAARDRPDGQAVLRQRWQQQLFLHWRWDAAMVQQTLPPGLTVDTFNGCAWLAITPFLIRDVRPPLCPVIPVLSHFLECNVRTYVFDSQGRPGVWFYSLDANSWLAVKLARAWFHLPYQHAKMRATLDAGKGEMDYSLRRWGSEETSSFRYRVSAPAREVAIGSLEFFLLECYRLFSQDEEGRLFTARVAHAPYQVGTPEVTLWDDRPLQWAGFDPDGQAPGHMSAVGAVDVEVFNPERVEAKTSAFAEDPVGEQAMPA